MTNDESRAWSRQGFVIPTRVEVRDGFLAWSDSLPDTGSREHVLGDLLADFIRLERSTPDEMAAFLESYGVPELCHHSVPDRHEWAWAGQIQVREMPQQPYCSLHTLEDGRPAVWTVGLQRVARAFSAASRLGLALRARSTGDDADWVDLQLAQRWSFTQRHFEGGWEQRRLVLSDWLTQLLLACGVAPAARWAPTGRLVVTPEADGLLGSIALALAYEVGQQEGYLCSVCGGPAHRVRPPQPGERVYCTKAACKREQQRINQKAYRDRKRTERKA